jgi:hypothetical protein
MSKWKMVPVEPTLDMLHAAVEHQNAHADEPGWAGLYNAMCTAAPPAPGCIDLLCPCQDGALCHYVDGPDGTMALAAPSAEPSEPVIAGALFDFLGYLTSRKTRLVLSSRDNANEAVQALEDWANLRGLSLTEARVQDWQASHPPPVEPTTECTSCGAIVVGVAEPSEPAAWTRDGWGPDCGSYVEFYTPDEMGSRDRTGLTPLYAHPAPALPTEVHPDDEAVDEFAARLKVKLARNREKGRNGWRDPSWPAVDINRQMHEHAAKGDPLDVAAYAMFLALRGEATTAAPSAAPSEANECRIALVVAVDELVSQIENTLHVFRGDDEARRNALGAIAHARKVTARWRYNGSWRRQIVPHAEPSEPVSLETVYETIIAWDEGGGKRSRRELARRIVALYGGGQ